jgi:hypothetical protein
MINIEIPFTIQISGPSGSGKSTFIVELLNHLPIFNSIYWCNAEKHAIPEKILHRQNLKIISNLPESFENVENGSLIVLDDLMSEAYNKVVCNLFTKDSHHRKLSIIFTLQNVFHQGRFCRDISLNCKYLVFFKNPRDKSQILPLARQIYPENPSELVRVYKEVTSKPHGYLFFDLTQSANDLIRLQTDI